MGKLVEWINKHTELYPPDEEVEHPHTWQLTCRQEIYTYFRVLAHMGITVEPAIKDY